MPRVLLRNPDSADLTHFIRKRHLSPDQAAVVQERLASLVRSLNARPTHDEVLRERDAQVDTVAKLRAILVKAAQLAEAASPSQAGALRDAMSHINLGRLLNSDAVEILTGQPIGPGRNSRLLVSRKRFWHSGKEVAIEERGEQVLAGLFRYLAHGCRSELEFLKGISRRGRPADGFRMSAIYRLLALYEDLHGRFTASTPSNDLLNFLHDCFGMIGLSNGGLDDAVVRLIKGIRETEANPLIQEMKRVADSVRTRRKPSGA